MRELKGIVRLRVFILVKCLGIVDGNIDCISITCFGLNLEGNTERSEVKGESGFERMGVLEKVGRGILVVR